ncbi:MAG: hypothetical protein ABIO04_07860 [Ferruginibacter sp.]
MRLKFYFCSIILLFVIGCKQKETKVSSQPRANIYLPSKSANVVFHIKDNKVASYEIQNEDGTPITEQLMYRRLNETGEETCYRCPAGVTDVSKCTKIPCPIDPCKQIHCGPLNFQINEMSTASGSEEGTQFTIVADGVKQ